MKVLIRFVETQTDKSDYALLSADTILANDDAIVIKDGDSIAGIFRREDVKMVYRS